jgi:hypothetical protein
MAVLRRQAEAQKNLQRLLGKMVESAHSNFTKYRAAAGEPIDGESQWDSTLSAMNDETCTIWAGKDDERPRISCKVFGGGPMANQSYDNAVSAIRGFANADGQTKILRNGHTKVYELDDDDEDVILETRIAESSGHYNVYLSVRLHNFGAIE